MRLELDDLGAEKDHLDKAKIVELDQAAKDKEIKQISRLKYKIETACFAIKNKKLPKNKEGLSEEQLSEMRTKAEKLLKSAKFNTIEDGRKLKREAYFIYMT